MGYAQIDYSGILDSDECQDNNIVENLTQLGVTKVVPLYFHVIQDLASEKNFPDNANTRSVMQDVVDRANEKLSNNQPMNLWNPLLPSQPPVLDIDFRFKYQGIQFYQSSSWPGGGNNEIQEDPNALNVRCREARNRWIPQPETFGLAYTQSASCGNADGMMVLYGLTPGNQYQVRYRLNGSSTITNAGSFVGSGQGFVTISGLEAGSYTDISLRDDFGQDLAGTNASISNTGAPGLNLLSISNVSSCTANNGSIIIINTAGGNGQVRLLYQQDGVDHDVMVAMSNGIIMLTNLPVGYYSHIRLVTNVGCVSNSIHVSIKHTGAPTISANRVIPFSGSVNDASIELGGLTSGIIYKAWVRLESSGAFIEHNVQENNGTFTIDSEVNGVIVSDFGDDLYYEVYLTDAQGCNRSNTLTFRPGDDVKPSALGGSVSGAGASVMNIQEM